MIIKVDCREKKLLKCMEEYKLENVKVEKTSLHLGDVIICNEENKECVIIERKTLRDLGSSILDGRYVEQSFRLKECSCPNIYYFIEGDIDAQEYNLRLPDVTCFDCLWMYFRVGHVTNILYKTFCVQYISI